MDTRLFKLSQTCKETHSDLLDSIPKRVDLCPTFLKGYDVFVRYQDTYLLSLGQSTLYLCQHSFPHPLCLALEEKSWYRWRVVDEHLARRGLRWPFLTATIISCGTPLRWL